MKTLSLWLFFMICLMILLPVNGSQQNPKDPLSNKSFSEQKLQKIGKALEEFHVIANKHFKGCSVNDTVKILLANCSMPTKDYANFLYQVHKKEYTLDFIKLYKQQNRMDEIYKSDMDDFIKKIKVLLMSAFNEWIEIFKPKSETTIDQTYMDFLTFDCNILDVVEHNPTKYRDLIDMLKTFRQITPKSFLKARSSENTNKIAKDMEMMIKKYASNPEEWETTRISRKQFIYFVRDLALYIFTALLPDYKDKETITITQKDVFQFTSMVKKQVDSLQLVIGESLLYSQTKIYIELIISKMAKHFEGGNKINLTSLRQTEKAENKEASTNQEGHKEKNEEKKQL